MLIPQNKAVSLEMHILIAIVLNVGIFYMSLLCWGGSVWQRRACVPLARPWKMNMDHPFTCGHKMVLCRDDFLGAKSNVGY